MYETEINNNLRRRSYVINPKGSTPVERARKNSNESNFGTSKNWTRSK